VVEGKEGLKLEEAVRSEREIEREWRRGGELQATKVDATISGWISANACLSAESRRTVLFSAKTTSSASTIPRRSFP